MKQNWRRETCLLPAEKEPFCCSTSRSILPSKWILSALPLVSTTYIHSLAVEEMTQVHAGPGTERQIYFITSPNLNDLVVLVWHAVLRRVWNCCWPKSWLSLPTEAKYKLKFGGNRKVALILSWWRGEHSRLMPQELCPTLMRSLVLS